VLSVACIAPTGWSITSSNQSHESNREILCFESVLFAGDFKPVQLEGWVFYPGLNAAAEDDKAAEGGWETLQQLAEQCSSKGRTGHGPVLRMLSFFCVHCTPACIHQPLHQLLYNCKPRGGGGVKITGEHHHYRAQQCSLQQLSCLVGAAGGLCARTHVRTRNPKACSLLLIAAGYEAFTTDGKVISSLQHHSSWKRTSYRPYEGTYVRSSIAAAVGPKPAEPCQAERAGAAGLSGMVCVCVLTESC
jgi:hypothetical protein